MLRTKLAKKVLSKKEQKHLTEGNIHSLAAMKRQVEFNRGKDHITGCVECHIIATKLGLE